MAIRLVLHQWRAENRAFWRNPASAVFTFVFPLLFMVILNVIFSTREGEGGLRSAAFLTPAIVCFSVVNACFTTLAMGVTLAREEGILKRIRGTPLPTWAYILARILQSMLVAAILVGIVSAFGLAAFGVAPPLDRLPELALVLTVGAGACCAIGLAVAGVIPGANAAPAIVNAVILPLLFISDVFVQLDDGSALARIADLFPIRHLSSALQAVYAQGATGGVTNAGRLDAADLLWLAGWGTLGALVTLRTFRWEPRS